ncbi:U3 containing 90S pre-ribosomal complex subunit [Tasmannia lanceolata]|uniref:U3 containing 90S pre-ribosomal complex subunit n=1 Tax=Tasmannia lanceolata TaxID=3420 RepID=UPI004064B850
MGSMKPTGASRQKGRQKGSKTQNPNRIPLGKNRANTKRKEKKINKRKPSLYSNASSTQQLRFFLDRFQSSNGIKLSALELEGFKDTCILELSQDLNQDAGNLGKHLKATFGISWREVLTEGQLSEGKIDEGSPAVVIISTSALRSLELLRGLRLLTGECPAAKLFAKHMKVEEQVSLLKTRVNIASGTPSRIKKLIDMDALGLSRLSVLVIDMHTDAKGYSLFSLPQVSTEFWELYRSHFHQRLLQGDLRICFYGLEYGDDLEKTFSDDEIENPAPFDE